MNSQNKLLLSLFFMLLIMIQYLELSNRCTYQTYYTKLFFLRACSNLQISLLSIKSRINSQAK